VKYEQNGLQKTLNALDLKAKPRTFFPHWGQELLFVHKAAEGPSGETKRKGRSQDRGAPGGALQKSFAHPGRLVGGYLSNCSYTWDLGVSSELMMTGGARKREVPIPITSHGLPWPGSRS